MKKYLLLLLILASSYSYAQMMSPLSVNKANFEQKFTFTVNSKETSLNEKSNLFSASYLSSHLMITILENRKDMKFSFFISMKELKMGTYTVTVCKANNDCTDGQAALYIPLSGGTSLTSLPKSGGYDIPNLNLKPLEFTINSVEDAEIPNMPQKAKRIKGYFAGVFAMVNDGKIMGSVEAVRGEFDLWCLIFDNK